MFIVFQYPLTDFRPFISGETGRLLLPTWPAPIVDKQFVRGFGPVVRRPKGGLSDWPAETDCCAITKGIRFRLFDPREIPLILKERGKARPLLRFKRLFSDGMAMIRIEIGFELRHRGQLHLSSAQFDRVIQGFGRIQAFLPKDHCDPSTDPDRSFCWSSRCCLDHTGERLAGYFQESTTLKSWSKPRRNSSWVVAAKPLIYVEVGKNEQVGFPPFSRTLDCTEFLGAKISYVAGKPDLLIVKKTASARCSALRELRIRLSRINAEYSNLRNLLALLARKSSDDSPEFPSSPLLERYIPQIFARLDRNLNRASRLDPQIRLVVDLAYDLRELVTPGERAALESSLQRLGFSDRIREMVDSRVASVAAELPSRGDRTFDVAISYSSDQRHIARALYDELRFRRIGRGRIRVFFDEEFTSQLWGEHLPTELLKIYQSEARYCVILVSSSYRDKQWTNHELRSALSRQIKENGRAYILPIQVEPVELPGLDPGIHQIPLSFGIGNIAESIMKKLILDGH